MQGLRAHWPNLGYCDSGPLSAKVRHILRSVLKQKAMDTCMDEYLPSILSLSVSIEEPRAFPIPVEKLDEEALSASLSKKR